MSRARKEKHWSRRLTKYRIYHSPERENRFREYETERDGTRL